MGQNKHKNISRRDSTQTYTSR